MHDITSISKPKSKCNLNMKYFHILSMVLRNRVFINNSLNALRGTSSISFKYTLKTIFLTNKVGTKFIHTEDEQEESISNEDLSNENEMEYYDTTTQILFKNSQDDIIIKLNSCVSVEEVLNVVMQYKNIYEDKHAVQTILVLRNLQKIFYYYNGYNSKALHIFLQNLKDSEGFHCLLKYIEDKLDCFEPEYLNYVLLYLNKLGIPMEDELIQSISLKTRNYLVEQFSLEHCTRFLTAVFSENSVRPYYLSLPIIPLVINCIERCNSVNELYYLTACLNTLQNIVTAQLLVKYKKKVQEFLKNKKLSGAEYPTILKIILFLNYPQWRERNVVLISDCILSLKNEINLLNVVDLTILYQIFFKNQEPGIVLNSIQRCSAKFLHQLEDSDNKQEIIRLKLFSSLIYFSSPTHRVQFRKHLEKYVNNCTSYNALGQLRKIFSYVKASDPRLCERYWHLSRSMLNEDVNPSTVITFCENYIHFNTDINNYRHYQSEKYIMRQIKKLLVTDSCLNPLKICAYLSFAMVYSRDESIVDYLLEKFENSLTRIKPSDCLKLSYGLSLLNNQRSNMTQKQILRTKNLLNEYTRNFIENDEVNYLENSLILKSCVLRNDFDYEVLDKLLTKYKELEYMSSKILENICYIFLATHTLIPEVINKCTEYVIKHHNNILGFNAEKLLFLCYRLAYCPINEDKFFEVVVDVIIRDQERLSGLTFLQSALSLCFYNKLPGSFIKQIFNVEFMEKLDVELENCYSKDKYPQRVRETLMILNRAVCLEYPEYNVPWFHKKFVENVQRKFSVVNSMDNTVEEHVREHLVQVIGSERNILDDIVTPYGYHIDFVINLNRSEEVVPRDSPDITRRIAFLLLQQNAYTRLYTHLKGKYQLKIRHLEILGYEVVVIKINEWVNLLYGEERMEYLSKLIWSKDDKNSAGELKS